MAVRAKFVVTEIRRSQSYISERQADGTYKHTMGELQTVAMIPVHNSVHLNPENEAFWHATPQGKVELGMINAETAAMFEFGKAYYLDFTSAPD